MGLSDGTVALIHDLGKPELTVTNGQMTTSRGPGIEQEPDPELLERWQGLRAEWDDE